MGRHGCDLVVFSSTATVYGEPVFLPYTEEHPLAPTSVYGHTKRFAEHVPEELDAPGESTQ